MSKSVETARGTVHRWQCDHMGHVNVRAYGERFEEACWQFYAMLGLKPSRLRSGRRPRPPASASTGRPISSRCWPSSRPKELELQRRRGARRLKFQLPTPAPSGLYRASNGFRYAASAQARYAALTATTGVASISGVS